MITHRGGHSDKSPGASLIINERTEVKAINNLVNKRLDELKVKHKDVSNNLPYPSCLNKGINDCNKLGSNLFASIHMNKLDDNRKNKAMGVEVWVYDEKFKQANQVLSNLVALGFKNRGIKSLKDYPNKDLAELERTKCKAMIIEICFVDSIVDVNLYLKVGKQTIADAIAYGLLGQTVRKKQKYYSVLIQGMTDEKRCNLITDFLDKNYFKYKKEVIEK